MKAMRTRNKFITAVSVLAAAAMLTSCSGSRETQPSYDPNLPLVTAKPVETTQPEENEAARSTAGKLDGVKEAADGALLTISNTTAKPGEYAEVTLSVSNADKKWNMCGLHITFPDVLECQMFDEERRYVEAKKGDAVSYATGSVAMLWRDNLDEHLSSNNLLSVFFTAIFDGDYGKDGDIVTYYFKIPEDAQSGTVYPIEYYYCENDVFSNSAKDLSYDKYAFNHWTGGSITVE